MAHIRYFEANALVEVTVTTLDNRYLLRPSPVLNRTILGILGRGQRIYDMVIVDFKFMSSHAHLLLRPRDAGQLGEFMCFVNTNLSKELGKIHKIRGPKLQRPFHLMEISDEERAQTARLRYLISNSVKEHLVERPEKWPGVQGVTAACLQEGVWYSRTKQFVATQRGETVGYEDFAEEETVVLSPLPCWDHLEPEEIERRIQDIVEDVVEEAAQVRRAEGIEVKGEEAILAMDPFYCPPRVKKSPQPRFYAATKTAFQALWTAYSSVAAAFRDAAERLAEGARDVLFPEGTHPPAAPFVAFGTSLASFEGRGQPA